MSAAQVLTRYLKRNSRRLSRQSSRESTSLLSEYDDQIRHFVKIVADFTQQLSKLHSRHAEELQLLVEAFRKRNSELRKERPPYHSSLFNCWEVLLQEVEVDSQVHGDISRCLSQHMGVMLLEKTFHRKAQSRKVFLHRESFENILVKAEELLNKCQGEYAEAYRTVCRRGCTDLTAAPLDQPSPLSASEEQAALAAYYDCHNAYVQQLAATNGMLDEYYGSTLPRLLDELQDVYCDISTIIAQSMLAASDVLANKAREQADHYEAVGSSCRAVNARSDLAGFVRTLCSTDPRNPTGSGVIPATPPRHPFVPPRADDESVSSGDSQLQQPTLGEQVIVDRLASLSVSSRSESLRQDVAQLEVQVRQQQDTLDALLRMQQRSLESSLYNKANELQEDISMKRFDLHVAQIHLAAVKAQFALFRGKEVEADAEERNCRERKASTAVPAVTGTIKNKWLKAFRSLKTSSGASDKPDGSDRKGSHAAGGPGGAGVSWDTGQHVFQEYTYKKVTACDVCREILRGHVRQGLKCKLCKFNVHAECQDKASRCQPKPRLLRRQRSASEIETKIIPAEPEEEKTPSATPDAVDPIYQLLKQAGDLGGSSRRDRGGGDTPSALSRLVPGADRDGGGSSSVSSSAASLQQRRPRSNASSSASSSSSHMLSVSSHQHHPSSSAPQSPVHGRRQLLSAKAVRMSSVDLPDDNEKSLSSASTSPCPSPASAQKPHRLLPTNLYVVLYNFRSRHQDELDLKAGDTVTVIDTTDPDWWQGKCLGRVGFFPSKYVAKLHPGERALQVLHSIQVMDGQEPVKLLRDQIVIQVADEMDGKVLVRTGLGDKALPCPLKYLQEV
ncbi:SH3 and cysteine-rich domain-containing protein isoform X6 [Rhipicephalus microplus]|uniref:SH3 and cysteine-rich domain-containing protein isoform X6 n=1 Tax=Rhipicephalus microplus TaxID=6941 RepID=UPI003F6D6886